MALFVVAAIVRGIRREDDQAAVDGERLELDAKAATLFMRKCRSDLGPALLRFAVAPVFFDGEDVQVSGCRHRGRGWRLDLAGFDLISIVHPKTPSFSGLALDLLELPSGRDGVLL